MQERLFNHPDAMFGIDTAFGLTNGRVNQLFDFQQVRSVRIRAGRQMQVSIAGMANARWSAQ